jgi:hypothetical protein
MFHRTDGKRQQYCNHPALSVIDNDLQCSTALTVNGNSTVTIQLTGIGVSQTSLADGKAIITWMENNEYPVEYLAVCKADSTHKCNT